MFDTGYIMPTNSLEFIQNLFKSISDDSRIPYEIKPYLMGLKTPVIKASNDKRFCSDTLHPVRMALILLTKISASEKNTRELAINISKITDKLIHSVNITSDDFVKANISLISLINEREKDSLIKEYEEAEKKKGIKAEKYKFRQLVITELQEIISDNRIPILAHELTLKIWPQFMLKKCLEGGASGTKWIEAIDQFTKIIRFLQPIQDMAHWQTLNGSFESFVDSIDELLNSSDINKERIGVNTEALRRAIRININQFKIDNKLLFVKSQKHEDTTDSKFDELVDNKLSILPASVKVGKWYDLYTAENCAANRLKLSLIVEEEGKLIFVDHRGIKGMVKDVDVFAEELSRYLSKPVRSDKPRFVDTWNELIDKIPKFNR